MRATGETTAMLSGKNVFVGIALCIAAGSAVTLGYLLFSTTLSRDTYFWGRLLLGAVSISAAWATIVAAGGFKRPWKAWLQPQPAAALVVALFSAFGVAVDSLSLMVPGAALESTPKNIETMVRELLERGPRHVRTPMADPPSVSTKPEAPVTPTPNNTAPFRSPDTPQVISAPLTITAEAATGSLPPQTSPSKLYAYDDTHSVREGDPVEGHAYKYTPLGCDWRATRFGRISCSMWIEADNDLMVSRVTNRPQLEMADGSFVPAQFVALTSDTTGEGLKGKLIADFYFSDPRSKGLPIDAQLARSSVLLHIGFPTLEVANARAVLFSIGAGDKVKRISIVQP